MKQYDLNQDWMMRRVGDPDWLPASVPGSVYGDLLTNNCMEDPFWKDNELAALALMEHDYEYETKFVCDDEMLSADDLLLCFDGIDTIADIEFNGNSLAHVENMHRTWTFSVCDLVVPGVNVCRVILRSPTRFIRKAFAKSPTRGTEDAMDGFVHLRKAHCMFGWDWGAHLPDAGIWRPVKLLAVDTARLESVEILQYHENAHVRLCISPQIITAPKASGNVTGMIITITDPDGTEVINQQYPVGTQEILIDRPRLWWPRGYGDQPLYEVSISLLGDEKHLPADQIISSLNQEHISRDPGVIPDDGLNILDTKTCKIGLRTIMMDRTPDQWGERFAVCVNGINIFAMGADYIPEDHLLGRVTPQTTRTLLEKAVFANFNSIRVWGGGYYPDDWFYDFCDEMGLLIWQDFMFACAVYDLTPEFEANITAEFIDNIKRLRHHASLALMCGNNEMELFVKERNWVSKDSEVRDYLIMYERILPSLMKEYAPQVFYWPASPSSGGSFDDPGDENRGDVHYWDVWHGNKPFSEYRKFHFRYLSEFGFQSFPARKTVETFIDDERDMNIFSYIMERHQRNGSANGKIMNYMQQTYLYPSDFNTVIYASQLLQADAIRYGVEHFRRNRNDSRCMGAVYWQFNDCWPVASWSSVDYCQRLKALHYYARRFFAPIIISCEEEGMMGSGQELVRLPFDFPKSIRLCVSNETISDCSVTVCWQLRNTRAQILRSETMEMSVPALHSSWIPKVELPDVDIFNEYVSYQAVVSGTIVSEGTVLFSYPKYFRFEDPALRYEVHGNEITVSASAYARSIEIQNENEDLVLTNLYFDLNGDSKTVTILSGDPSKLHLRSVYDIR